MKHFKYHNERKAKQLIERERIKLYSKKDQKKYKLEKFLMSVLIVVDFFLITISIGLVMDLIEIDNIFLGIIVNIVLVIIIILIPSIVCLYIAVKIEKKLNVPPLPRLNHKGLLKCTAHLRKYYHINNEYVVTKCYECSNELLVNKDLLIYFYDDKLRITNNLMYVTKDFGCFEFDINEIKVYNIVQNNKVMTIIETPKVMMKLGYRARTFFQKQNKNK